MIYKILTVLAGIFIVAIWAAPAAAQSCCAASQTAGPVRLSMGQSAAVGLAVDGRSYSGVFAGQEYRRLQYPGHEFRQTLFGSVRLGDDWQLGATMPVVQNRRQTASDVDWGGGIGDVGAQARYEIMATGASMTWPGIGIVGSVVAPTGRSPLDSMQRAHSPLQADVTGAHSWNFDLGAQVEWVGHSAFLAIDVGANQALPYRDRRDQQVMPGTGLRARVSVGRPIGTPIFWDETLYVAGSLSTAHKTNRRFDSVTAANTSERMTTVSLQAGAYLTESIHLLLRGSYDLPIDYAGANRMAGPGVGLTLKRVFYDY